MLKFYCCSHNRILNHSGRSNNMVEGCVYDLRISFHMITLVYHKVFVLMNVQEWFYIHRLKHKE